MYWLEVFLLRTDWHLCAEKTSDMSTAGKSLARSMVFHVSFTSGTNDFSMNSVMVLLLLTNDFHSEIQGKKLRMASLRMPRGHQKWCNKGALSLPSYLPGL